ncbi:MAG: hypothetical protein R3290_12490 [Acidimicrobiia bacterium]|nr:hypothetical protein [Acidimicrobiia bacterium]
MIETTIQVGIALLIGLAIWRLGLWGVRMLATPVPEEPDPEEIVDVEQTFLCSVCGMQLTVTYAQATGVTAPRHCREEMEPV